MSKPTIPVCCLPRYITFVLRRIEEKGYDAFLVGGCVRDIIMNRQVNDYDIATSAYPEEVAGLFPKTIPTGARYGTVAVVLPEDTVEVTTFRSDGEYRDGRHPESVKLAVSIVEDLSRRDFTMNALALSVEGEIIDPFGGIHDIKKRTIRCVGTPDVRFNEDALRMLRAYRFSAELGFAIETETSSAIRANAEKAKLISAERVRIELEKTLISKRPQIAGAMINAGLLDKYITARGSGAGYLDRLALLPETPALRWCALCALLMNDGIIASAGRFLFDLRHDSKTVKTCATALSIPAFPNDRAGVKRLLAKHGTTAVRCAAAADDTLHQGASLEKTDEITVSGECFSLSGLAISGRDLVSLGYDAGPSLGETLSKLLDHVIQRPEDNTREKLLAILESD